MTWRARSLVLAAVTLVIVVSAAFVNYAAITEAYGEGAPYYGRTTNMDKWTSPVPTLAAVDVLAVVLLLGTGYVLLRATSKRARGG